LIDKGKKFDMQSILQIASFAHNTCLGWTMDAQKWKRAAVTSERDE